MPTKEEHMKDIVKHIDIKTFDATPIIDSYKHMSFSSRDLANAAIMFDRMVGEKDCTVILTIAGSTSAGGCMQLYADLLKNNMVDAIVATGATIVDMDFFEALGFKHYQGAPDVDDKELRSLYIDRIYDTYIDEEQLQECDAAVAKVADMLPPRPHSSREFIREMGRYLTMHSKKKDSLVQAAYEKGVPIFCPAFSDSSAGFGLVHHQWHAKGPHVTIDSVKDFLELTKIKMKAGTTGLLMIGGGTPKNFAQDTVVCAEVLGKEVPLHKYAIQITVADPRDGACSSSTLKEANSWGKVDSASEQMVFSEATMSLPLLASYAYHRGSWKQRQEKRYGNWLDSLKEPSDMD